jgi:prepilin-type N-terminal cleavage/methylation domain-containing protein
MMQWFNTKLRDAQRKRMNGHDEGFTLVELLVVILIIGVLSGIVVLAVSNSTDDAKSKACTQNAVNLLSALDTYKATSTALGGGEGSYPTAAASAVTSGTFNGYKPYTVAELTAALVPKFIKKVPATTEVVAYVNTTTGNAAIEGKITGCSNQGI